MEEECCPEFDPAPWDGKILEWENKRFVRDKVKTFFFIPLNFGSVITKLNEKVEKAGATIPDRLCLSDDTSRWNMDIYIEVPKEIPNAEHARLSGSFLTRVFEGPFQNTGQWCAQMAEWVRSKNKTIKRHLMYYTTCPKCAKHYGKNYVVILAQV